MKWAKKLLGCVGIALSLVVSEVVAAEGDVLLTGDYQSVLSLFLFLGGVLLTGALIVTALTHWSRKQDEINNMMYFCFDFLVNTRNESERVMAAKALGRAKIPEAVPVLVDVVNDETEDEGVRGAAGDALQELGQTYDRFRKAIVALVAATEKQDHARIVELLKKHFESGRDKYVQSAYVIGRELIRLEDYADAREWLRTAGFRNRELPLYFNHIRDLIAMCNQYLFNEGDVAYNSGDYHSANEHYALASHGLSDEENNHFSYYLRAACVYYKLGDLSNTRQALLQALHHRQETNTALELNEQISRLMELKNAARSADPDYLRLAEETDEAVQQIMNNLSATT